MITNHRREQCKHAQRRYRANHPERAPLVREQSLDWWARNPIKMLLSQAKKRAKRKGIPFEITEDDLSRPTHCPVLGIELKYGPGRGRKLYDNPGAASIDRIRNSDGYVPGNVLIISLRANLLKGQASIEELQKIASFYGRLQ